MKMRATTYSLIEEIILRTKIPFFRELSIEDQHVISIYSLQDDSEEVYFPDFMPSLLMLRCEKKITDSELVEAAIDHIQECLCSTIEGMYEECSKALALEKLIPRPSQWDKPDPDPISHYAR
jgi:hypothetical protein